MSNKIIFMVSFIFVLGMVSPSVGNAADPYLGGWWKLDGDVLDSSGNDRHGMLNGNPPFVAGMYNEALGFDGDDYLTIGGYKGILGSNPFSISIWINTTYTGDIQEVVYFGTQTGGQRCEFRVHSDGHMRMGNGSGQVQSGTDLRDGEWHHVVTTIAQNATNSSSDVRMYLDGRDDTVESSDPDAFNLVADWDVTIGYRPSLSDRPFIGSIDDIRIYERVLVASQVQDLFSGIDAFVKAFEPSPADGVIHTDTWVNLQWSPGGDAVSHDVYLGENFDDVAAGTGESFVGNQTGTFVTAGFPGFPYPDGLVPGTTYYWRIDEVKADGTKQKGSVWSFSVPSLIATNPGPADGDKFADPDIVLSWTAGHKAKLHTVYFGDNFDDVNSAAGGISRATTDYSPGLLELDKLYYWRVDEFDGTATHKGDFWSFRTEPFIPITDPNLVCWWTLEEASGRKVVDWSGHGHDGTFQGEPEWVYGYDGYALHFNNETDFVVHSLETVADWSAGTVTLWVKADSVGQDQYSSVFSNYAPNTAGFQIDVDGGYPGVYRVNPPGGQTLVFGTASTEWIHLALTFNGTSAMLYYNGIWTGSGALDDTTFNQFAIAQNRNTTNSISGIIDDFRVYDKVLTQQEIQMVMRIDPLLAWGPSPKNGATPDIENATPLSWLPGDMGTGHNVYFGTDRDTVAGADTSDTTGIYRGSQSGKSYYPPEGVEWGGGPYYWRIDENNTDGTVTKGRVWTFTVADYILIDDFETYNAGDNQIWYAWHDGLGYGSPDVLPYYVGNGTGAAVGNEATASYTEETIVHGDAQSMPLFYDNNKQGYAMYSQVELTLSAPRDWTTYDLGELSLWFRGYPRAVGSFTEGPAGIYTMTASGTDISGTADQFHYAFKVLTGPGSIIARVDSVQNTNVWAKAGVMIRETLDVGSKHAFACVTPGSGVAFQGRTAADSDSFSSNQTGITAPHWVKLERDVSGNFTVSHSANGSAWQPVGNTVPTNIPMSSNVYIGLALTSHDTALTCEAVFSNVTINGTVAPQWMSKDIGILGNNPEPLYVAVSNKTGAPAVVYHDDPDAAVTDTWTEWVVPLQAFADQGVNLADVDKIAIGLGTQGNMTTPGGSGTMFFDDIRLYRPQPEPEPQP